MAREARLPGEGSQPVQQWNFVEQGKGSFQKTERLHLVIPGKLPGTIIEGIKSGAFTAIAIHHGYFSNGDRLTHREENGEHKYFITKTQAPEAGLQEGITSRKKDLIFVDEGEFQRLWKQTNGKEVKKKRYILPKGQGPQMYLDVYDGKTEYDGKMVVDVVFQAGEAGRKELEEFSPPDWMRSEPTVGILSEELAEGGTAVDILRQSASLHYETILFERSSGLD